MPRYVAIRAVWSLRRFETVKSAMTNRHKGAINPLPGCLEKLKESNPGKSRVRNPDTPIPGV